MYTLTKILSLVFSFFVILFHPFYANAAVLFQSNAESGTCDTAVATSVWDYTESGDGSNSRAWYRCATPVTSVGHSKYFQINGVDGQHDAWNQHDVSITLTPGTEYFLGWFHRIDRIGGIDFYHDGDGEPNSYDKSLAIRGSGLRWMIATGFPDWATCSGGACNGHYSFGIYQGDSCSGCIYEQVEPNYSPYSRSNMFLADYERWYAVVIGITPNSSGSTNGRLRMWINGIQTHYYPNIKTQDSTSPAVSAFEFFGTWAQPAYDAKAHYRKIDQITLTNSLADITAAGLMSDPAGTGGTTAPTAATGLTISGGILK